MGDSSDLGAIMDLDWLVCVIKFVVEPLRTRTPFERLVNMNILQAEPEQDIWKIDNVSRLHGRSTGN